MSENSGEIPPTQEPISNIISARSALLDFFSDRATSFGGFFLAAIFGLVSMLGVAQGITVANENYAIRKVVSFIAYVGFAFMGRYSFQRFKYYADLADRLYTDLRKSADLISLNTLVGSKGKVLARKFNEYSLEKTLDQEKLFLKKILRKADFDILFFSIIFFIALTVYYNDLSHIIKLISQVLLRA